MLRSLVRKSFPRTTVSTKTIEESFNLTVRSSMDARAEVREFDIRAGSTISLSGKQTIKITKYYITTSDGRYQLAFVEEELKRGNRKVLVIHVRVTDFVKRDTVFYRRRPRGSFAN